jgi:hypothetical protein
VQYNGEARENDVKGNERREQNVDLAATSTRINAFNLLCGSAKKKRAVAGKDQLKD